MNYTTADLDRWLTRGLGDRPYRRAVVRHDQAAGPADVRGLSPWSAVTINARVTERDNNGHGLRAVRDEAELSQHHESVPIPAEVLDLATSRDAHECGGNSYRLVGRRYRLGSPEGAGVRP